MSGFNQEVFQENWPRRDGDADANSDGLSYAAEAEAEAEAVRGDTLLEDWPKREYMASTSFNDSSADGNDVTSASDSNKGKGRHLHDVHVRFSEQSLLYVYHGESKSLLQSLAYSKQDYDKFGKDAVLEGLRIKTLIANAPPESGVESIKHLLSHDIIRKEDFLGIEHFIFGTLSTQSKIRKRHAAAVLRKQQKHQKQKLEDPDLNLAKFAETSSLRCKQRAKIRAGMAA